MRGLILAAIGIAAWLAASAMSHDDEAREAAVYCANVADGIWPDPDGRCQP